MNYNACLKAFAAAAALATASAVAAVSPVSTTKGDLCLPPALDTNAFVVVAPLETVSVPLRGWEIVWPGLPEAERRNVRAGVEITETNAVVHGALLPALRLEFTQGAFQNVHPNVELAWPLNAETHNILSFSAKIEVDGGLLPLIGDSPEIDTGWFSSAFNRYFDDFGVCVDDGYAQWSSWGVPTTHFRYHAIPSTRGADGFEDFVWDMKYGNHTGNKGFFRDRLRAIRFHYDTRKLPKGKKVVVTIARLKATGGARAAFPEPGRYAAWTNFTATYKPDYSDSSKYLRPPETGRIARPVRIAENGKPRAEIVVDLSDAIKIDNFIPREKWNFEILPARGHETQVARLAAYDLQRWIREVTGAELPVLTAPSRERNAKIFLGASFAKPHFQRDLDFLADGPATDGYAVREKDGNLYIFGARPAGTMFGVYAFVENNTDIIWAMQDPDGTVFTPAPTLDAVWADAVSKPAFIQRGGNEPSALKRQRGRNFMNGRPEEGTYHVGGGHYLCPQYYEWSEGIGDFNPLLKRFDPETGEYKAERPKAWHEGRTLACLAHPDFLGHATDSVPRLRDLAYSTYNPQCLFGVDDNYNVCECDLCTAPIKTKDGRTITPDQDYRAYYSAWFYTYLNKLDAAIQKVRPGFLTGTFAYFIAANYPPIEVSKNIAPMVCPYIRKSQEEPIFAPANAIWWKIYNDWISHNKNTMLYDYFGLGLTLKPAAEVHKADLQAQRDIGFLRTYSEGYCYSEYVGAADEQWCMAKLEWDPELDVEQLHRYYNRRTYREAAPWIDKFRGAIRERFYREFNANIEFEDLREVSHMIRFCGIEQELRGYLAEALRAVKNPKSRRLVEKMAADFDYQMTTDSGWDFPSKLMKETSDPLADAANAAWAKNRGVEAFFGRRELPRALAAGRGFDIACPVEKPAEVQVAFRFRAAPGAFAVAWPAVTLSGAAGAPCEYRWDDNRDGTWTCTVRAPAKAESFHFQYPELPPWAGEIPFVLAEIAFAPRGGQAFQPPAAPLLASAEFAKLKEAMAGKDAAALAAIASMATNASQPAVRVLAANEACRRSRGGVPLETFLAPSLGKSKGLGLFWALQARPVVKGLLGAGEADAALPWARDAFEAAGLSGDASRDSDEFSALFLATLKAAGRAEADKLLADQADLAAGDPGRAFQLLRSATTAAVEAGDAAYATDLLGRAFADRRVDAAIRQRFLREKALVALAAIPGVRAADLAKLLRDNDDDGAGHANGWSIAANRWGHDVDRVAKAFANRGAYAESAAFFDAWINWDGGRISLDERTARLEQKTKFLRNHRLGIARRLPNLERDKNSRPDDKAAAEAFAAAQTAVRAIDGLLAPTVDAWHQSLRDAARNGANTQTRGNAALSLLDEQWDALSRDQKLKAIKEIVDDRFKDGRTRQSATARIVRACADAEGKTDWAAAAAAVLDAVAAGDWSLNGRNVYSHSRRIDLRLDTLADVAAQMVKAERPDAAKALLERGSAIIGYFADSTADDEPGTSEADFANRLERLDAAMGACGAARPPRPAK